MEDDTEVPGVETDQGIMLHRKEVEELNNRQIWLTALYLSIEKNMDFSGTVRELYKNPSYGPLVYNNAGRSQGIIEELADPLSMQEVAQKLGGLYNYGDFFKEYAKTFIPNAGKFGMQYMLLNFIHKIKTGKNIGFEKAKSHPEWAKSLYKQYGGTAGILNVLSSPEVVSELSRNYKNFSKAFLRYAVRRISK